MFGNKSFKSGFALGAFFGVIATAGGLAIGQALDTDGLEAGTRTTQVQAEISQPSSPNSGPVHRLPRSLLPG